MGNTNTDLLSALLKWINTFDLKSPITSCNELADGEILWAILKDIDPRYFDGNLPEDDVGNWLHRWQNLKHVRRVVGLYMREECDCLPYLSRNLVPDLKAIALDGAKEPTTQLIQAVFLAAMYSPNSNQRMVKVLDNLGTKVALPLANAITDMQERDRILAENADNERSTSQKYSTTGSEADSNKIGIGRDPELESEEKLLQAHASIKRLENRSTEQIREIEALRAHTTKLEGKIAETKLRIDTEGRGAFEAETLKTLRAQYARDKDYIVELESDLESAKLTIESQRAQLERLKSDTASKQDLRDEIQLIRIERDELASKAKANDNLRKKIEHLQNEEKRNQELRQQLEATNESLQQYDDLQKTCEVLRTAHAESQRTIANQEIEIFHIKETKKRLEQELENINRDLRDSTEQASKHEETIVELQSRLNDIEAEQAGKGLAAGSLGAQIAQKELEDSKSAMSIKSTSNSGNNDADVTVLQQKLEAAEERNSKTEAHFLEVANENRGLRNLMKAATGDQEIEYRIHNQITGKTLTDWLGSKAPFVKQNEKLIAIRQEAEGYKRRYFDLLAELNEVQKLVSTATGPGYDAHALKKISQEGTEKLHRYSRSLGANLDQQKRFVGQSFGSRENNEIKENFGDELENRSEDHFKQGSRTEKLEAELKAIREVEKAKTILYEQSKLTIQNLERELRLMMSSWYDLGGRMQSGNVVLQRRPATPRSWIGRQRAMVGGSVQR